MGIYSPFLDFPLSFFLISQPYPFTPSSLSFTSRKSSCLHLFPLIDYSPEPSCGRTRQNRTSDLPLPLFVIHTKHTTQCLTTTSIKKWGTSASVGNAFEKSKMESRDYGMMLRGRTETEGRWGWEPEVGELPLVLQQGGGRSDTMMD